MEMRSNKNIRIGDVLQELGYINFFVAFDWLQFFSYLH